MVKMTVDKIVEAIEKSPLEESVQTAAIRLIRECSDGLESMFYGVPYKAPTALPGWYIDIAKCAMDVIGDLLLDNSVSVPDGQRTYANIFGAISDLDPEEYI